jgi:tetratricopeptide (TPR) repeat protein
MVGESESININTEELDHSSISKPKNLMNSVFLHAGKFAAGAQSFSKKTAHLISKEMALFSVKASHLTDKLSYTDVLYFKKSVELKPQSASANYNLASALLNKGRLSEAALYFKRAVLWDFRNTNAYIGMAKAYRELGKNTEAIEALKKALTYDEKNAQIHYELGITYEKNGEFKEAIDSFKRAIALQSNFKEAIDALTSLQGTSSASEQIDAEQTDKNT